MEKRFGGKALRIKKDYEDGKRKWHAGQ